MESAETPASPAIAVLDATEARILGCLIEKAAITPEVYPLTINAIVAACNQKTSRDPVMTLQVGAVTHALRGMEDRGLVKVAPSSQRAVRYEHRFDAAYGVTARQRAVLCVLMLRGAQTLGEIHTRTDRLAEFPSLDDVRDTLDRLIERAPPLAVRLTRGAGQREDRYMHLLGGPIDETAHAAAPVRVAPARADGAERRDLEQRVERLEGEVAELKRAMAALASPSTTGSDA